MNMRDLCLMNADKTDNSNTTGPGIKRPVLYFQGKNQLESQSAEIYMLRSKDRQVLLKKQRVGDIRQQPNQGTESHNGQNSHQDESVGEQEKSQSICKGSQCRLRNKRVHKHELLQKQLHITPLGNNPLRENDIIQIESNCISNSTGEKLSATLLGNNPLREDRSNK